MESRTGEARWNRSAHPTALVEGVCLLPPLNYKPGVDSRAIFWLEMNGLRDFFLPGLIPFWRSSDMARFALPDCGLQNNGKENQGDYNSLKNAAEVERLNEAAKEGDLANQGDASPLPGTFVEIIARAKWAWN